MLHTELQQMAAACDLVKASWQELSALDHGRSHIVGQLE